MYTLNRWLRQGSSVKDPAITIECSDDGEFFAAYSVLRSEVSCLQWAICSPREEVLPIKRVGGQMQVAFEMMGYKITIKSKQIHAEPIRAYHYGRFNGWND